MRIMYTSLFLITTSFLLAQANYTYVPHDMWTNYNRMAINEVAIVAAGYSQACSTPYVSYISKETGELIWNQQFENNEEIEGGEFMDVAFASDGSIWASGWMCDPGFLGEADDCNWILFHYDENGNLLDSHYVLEEWVDSNVKPNINIRPDGTVLWNAKFYVVKINPDGSIQQLNFHEYIHHMAAAEDNYLALNSWNHIMVYSDETDPVFEMDFMDMTIHDMDWKDGVLYWTDGFMLHYYDPDMDYHDQIETPYPIEAISLAEDGLLLYNSYEEPGSNAQKALFFDIQSHEFLESPDWLYPKRSFLQLEWDGLFFYQLGLDFYEPYDLQQDLHHGFVRRSMEWAEPLPEYVDIELKDIEATVEDIVTIELNDGLYQTTVLWDIEVNVLPGVNLPAHTSYILGSEAFETLGCTENRVYSVKSTLGSGEEIHLFEYPVVYTTTEPPSTSNPIEATFCFFATAPDHQLDAKPENDYLCETFVLQTTNVESPPVCRGSCDAIVYPNPADKALQINIPNETIKYLMLLDASGQLKMSKTVSAKEHYSLTLAESLLSGVYLLKIETDENIYYERIVLH